MLSTISKADPWPNGCLQCAAANLLCTWPEQRKRGPAKGYIEGLEHRLHEAETLLLQLLPVVTPEQLSTATAALTTASTRDSPERLAGRSSPPLLNKKTGIEYWENFPLDSVDNIRRWQADCAMHSQFRDEQTVSRGGSRPNSVDLPRDHLSTPVRKQSGMSQPQPQPQQQAFQSMPTDSYSPSRRSTPTSQPAYLSTQTSAAQIPAAQQQPWSNSSAFMQTGYTSNEQPWQQHQQQQHQHQQHQHQQGSYGQPQQQQQQQQMEVDNGFFPGDLKRSLFW